MADTRRQTTVGVSLFVVVALAGPFALSARAGAVGFVAVLVAALLAGVLIARAWAITLAPVAAVGFFLFLASVGQLTFQDCQYVGHKRPMCEGVPGRVIFPAILTGLAGVALGAGAAGRVIWREVIRGSAPR